jgi:tripartite-type tricarboxylate transporter receptor subunit TctC
MKASILGACALLCALLPGAAAAQAYPTKPVRIVVPYPAGGSIDLTARALGQRLTEALGRPFVVENRSGASGNIGTDFVAKAPADGYTLLMGSAAALAANPAIYPKLPFLPTRDFAPINLVVIQPNILLVHPTVPARSVKELIAIAQTKPGALNYGTSGVGSSQHMSAALFGLLTKTNMTHVPYKGGAPALTDLVGGQIDLMFETIPTTVQHVQSGRVRALAVTTAQRSEVFPDLPAMREAGLPGYEYRGWIGVLAPANTPAEIVARLHAETSKAMEAGLAARFKELALLIANRGPQDFMQFMREEFAINQKIAQAANIRAE